MKSLTYRTEIDGLRALAVAAVVLYHAGLKALPGGFVGVDVFFVISGYLISGIIFNDLEQSRFSLARFYERRIRRIQPALIAMVLVVLVGFAAIYTPIDYKSLAQSVGATATFSSNIYFFVKSGYFDPMSETKPLLHTWSLAVEEQYYLLFPLLVALLWKYGRKRINLVLTVLAIASFALSVWQARGSPNAAFYLPFGRFWELLIGALLAHGALPSVRKGWPAEALTALGLLMMGAALALLSPTDVFPGETALLPCVGAALVLHAGRESRVAAALLGNPLMTFVGKISYSVYLWHWPLFVAIRYLCFRELTHAETALYLAACVLAGWASWRWVEQPFRHHTSASMSRRGLFASTFAITGAGLVFAVVVHLGAGFPWRFDAATQAYAAAALDTNPDRNRCDRLSAERIRGGGACEIGAAGAGKPTFVLIGDSFGDAIAPGVDEAARKLGEKGLVITNSGCFPLLGIRQVGHDECNAANRATFDYVLSQPEIQRVLFVGRWTSALLGTRYGQFAAEGWFIEDDQSTVAGYAENAQVFERGLLRTVQAFKGRQVNILAYIPEQRYDIPRALALSSAYGIPGVVALPLAEHEQRQRQLRAVLTRLQGESDFSVTDVGATLCDHSRCAAQINGTALYADDNHLSRRGALMLEPVWEKALGAN